MSLTSLGCVFCLMQLPFAATTLTLVVFVPMTGVFVVAGSRPLILISIGSAAIFLTMCFSVWRYFEHFRAMVAAQIDMKTQNDEIARLNSQASELESRRKHDRHADLQRIAKAFTQSIEGVTCAMGDVAHQSSSQSEEVAACSDIAVERVERVSGAADVARNALQSVADSAGSLFEAIASIRSRMAQCSAISKTLESRTDGADKAMNSLDSAVGQIDEIAKMIKSIASQINLIALNATIEAARAGESGRGFAVVASEIKVLAHQTSQAISDVGRLVGNVKTASHDAKSSVVATKDAFFELRDVSEDVAVALRIQSAVTDDIRGFVGKAVEGAAVVRANLADMTGSATRTHVSARAMLSQCGVLQTQTDVLAREVNNFVTFIKTA